MQLYEQEQAGLAVGFLAEEQECSMIAQLVGQQEEGPMQLCEQELAG